MTLDLVGEVEMGDGGRGQREDSQHQCGDAGLEADEDGKAAKQFDQADDDGRCGRHRQADAAEPAGGAGNGGQLGDSRRG